MKIASLDDITADTSLSSILNSSEVAGKVAEYRTTVMKTISDRKSCLNVCSSNGSFSDSIMINNEYNSAKYAEALIDQYGLCEQAFDSFCTSVGTFSEQQEYKELIQLKTKVDERIESIKNDIKGTYGDDYDYDELSDDEKRDLSTKQRHIYRLETKKDQINARIKALSPSATGATSGSTSGAGAGSGSTGETFVNTGNDDNNHNYGAEYAAYDADTVKAWYGDYARKNWESMGLLGINGVKVEDGHAYGNPYYKMKGDNGEDVYVVCSSNPLYTGQPGQGASLVLFSITKDDKGHTICYDNKGNAIPYNVAMGLLDVDKCRQADGASGSVFTPSKSTDGHDVSWKNNSKADNFGASWSGYGNSNLDSSQHFQNTNLPTKKKTVNGEEKDVPEWQVYKKVKDSTKGNEVAVYGAFSTEDWGGSGYHYRNSDGYYVTTDNSKIFSVQVPNTATPEEGDYIYYYYDGYGNPYSGPNDPRLLKDLSN